MRRLSYYKPWKLQDTKHKAPVIVDMIEQTTMFICNVRHCGVDCITKKQEGNRTWTYLCVANSEQLGKCLCQKFT